ncbi:MAG: DUF4955 domain-containing protein [Cytophagales bacterium]|nr:DUF4955 domain-containing protein [Cytophagales bacterium]
MVTIKLNASIKKLLFLLTGILYQALLFGQTPEIWQDYLDDKSNGIIPELNDYSFTGYHFSEKEIPNIDGWTHFNVVDFGAIADDDGFDDDAIQAAIDAAEDHTGPAVVFFPSGRFMVSDNNNTNEYIRISRDSIVLKGSGSEVGGTEIFMKEMRVQNGHWQFSFDPVSTHSGSSTLITEPVAQGEHSIIVQEASGFSTGQVVLISHQSPEFAEHHFGDLPLSSQWTRLFGSGGMRVYELHEIKSITGTRITFTNPVQTDLPTLREPYVVEPYSTMQEVGVEDILFTSDWVNYPEDFVHHKDDIHDYAWNAMQFNHIRNGWVRNCEFSSWNQGIDVRESIGVTISNVTISGKKGHASFLTRRSYGLLVKDCSDPAGQHHGPGTGYSGVNTVYLRHSMLEDISVDSHSGQPYATLMDDVDGGVMSQNGGPHDSYPHHGQDFTFWNYRHKSSTAKTYDFWSIIRNGNTYAYPNFIGFQANNEVTFMDEGLNQMEGQMVSPRSLFEAQLELRLAESGPKISWLAPGYGVEVEINGDLSVEVDVTDDGSVSSVVLYINGIEQRTLTSAPYRWGQDQNLDPNLFNLSPGTYELKIAATDEDGNVSTDAVKAFVGKAPTINFVSPSNDEVVPSGVPVTIEASASDTDGTISSASLYFDDVLVSTITAAPFLWENESALASLISGEYALRLVATDNDGLVTEATQNLIVNDFPKVSFNKPTQQDVFEQGANVQVDVNATDNDGEIDEVRLYLNGTFQRAELNPPYTWGVQGSLDPELFEMPAGNYELEAIAVDNHGSESSVTIVFVVDQVLNTEQQKVTLVTFPNPFNQNLMIQSELPIQDIKLFNAAGALISIEIAPPLSGISQLRTDHLRTGMYILYVVHENHSIQEFKVIKK